MSCFTLEDREPILEILDLIQDRVDATQVGRLLAGSGTADIADDHLVVCARRSGQRVVTSDPDDLRRLDPELEVVTI